MRGRLKCVMAMLICTGIFPAQPAAASTSHIGALTCEGNRALVLFGTRESGLPALPDGIAPFHPEQTGSNTCTLSDGREVKVKIGERTPRAFGACGGGNNTFASLWVDGRRVLSRQWVLHDCFSDGHFDVFVLDGATLTLCTSAESAARLSMGIPVEVGCRDATDQLAAAQPDPVEYPAEPAPSRLFELDIIFNGRPDVCAAFLDHGWRDGDDVSDIIYAARRPATYHAASSMGGERNDADGQAEVIEKLQNFVVPDIAVAPTYTGVWSDGPAYRGYGFGIAHFDFDNDGALDLVMRDSGRSGGFWGDTYFIAQNDLAKQLTAKIDTLTAPGQPVRWPALDDLTRMEGVIEYTSVIAGVTPDYRSDLTHQEVFRVGDETIVFATAPEFARGTRPTAIISKPLPGGASETLCIYQRVEDNY
jgi:hypothetical protein